MQTRAPWDEIASEANRTQSAERDRANMPHWDPLRALANQNRRMEKRLPLVVPIRVHGLGLANQYFSERTFTLDVSERGCRFTLRTELQPGMVVGISLTSPNPGEQSDGKAMYEIAWVVQRKEGWEVGARRKDRKNIWGVTFPEPERME